jgi:hypothetical protein
MDCLRLRTRPPKLRGQMHGECRHLRRSDLEPVAECVPLQSDLAPGFQHSGVVQKVLGEGYLLGS